MTGLAALLVLGLGSLSNLAALSASDESSRGPASREFFETRVRPVLAENCFECHRSSHNDSVGEGPEAGLCVDSLAGILRGGRSGPAIVPGNSAESTLILAIRHDSFVQMPPKRKLTAQTIEDLAAWVDAGAHWPDDDPANAQSPDSDPSDAGAADHPFTEDERAFWSFQPIVDPPIPGLNSGELSIDPIDAFLAADRAHPDEPRAPPLGRRAWLRRATLDLHGLLPTPEEVADFATDDSPDAFAKVIDRLLASPRYGERWGRRWLDVARYADSNGMDDNLAYPDAWRYRDYVLRSFALDKPYDELIREQIAGDLLEAKSPEDAREALVATGFLMIGPKMLAEDDPLKQRMDIVDDQIDTMGKAILGLTLGCARCHDHKFDPIRLSDYYALAGIFKSTQVMLSYRVDSKWNSRALAGSDEESRLSRLESELDQLDREVVLGNFVGREAEKQKRIERLTAVKAEYTAISKAMAAEEDEPEDLHVFLRGNPLTRGEVAPRGFPRILSDGKSPRPVSRSSGRKELADWLTRRENPLTARVMVNRIWQGHFGQGLVETPDNFGKLGSPPLHPQLLDWLASRWIEAGWSMKALHRRIMLSDAYARGSVVIEKDSPGATSAPVPTRARRRMDAETLRDTLLFVGGDLDRSIGGPALNEPAFAVLSAKQIATGDFYRSRRLSVYLPVIRSGVYEVFAAFDFPDPAVSNGLRYSTTVAPQALFVMNSELFDGAAKALTSRLLREIPDDFDRRLVFLHEIAYSRSPESQELNAWRSFFRRVEALAESEGEDAESAHRSAWFAVCRVILGANEFLYIE